MDLKSNLRNRTEALLERGGGDTERLATEWAMPFIPDDGGNSPTDVPFASARRTQRPVSGCVTFFGRLLMLFGIVVLLGGIYGGFSMMRRDASRVIEPKIFQVAGVPNVRIENSVGRVEVLAGTTNQIRVAAEVKVDHLSQGLADRAVENYELKIDDSVPGTLVIRGGERNPFDGDDFFAGWMSQRSVDLTVTLPANSNLSFDVAAGSMRVEGITGRVNAVVHAGSLNLTDVTLTDGSTFEVNAGSIYFDGELQPDSHLDVQVHAGSADLFLPRTTDAYLEAHASAGGVRVAGWPGSISRIQTNDETDISGFLTGNRDTQSLITVNVNAGGVEIIGQTERGAVPVPSEPPSAPPAPSGPSAPSRP